jgi:4-oxalocrotonate tautomerase
MHLIQILTYPGRTREQKETFAKAVTNAAVEILKAKRQHVIITYNERLKIGILQENSLVNDGILEFQGCACSIRRFENDN